MNLYGWDLLFATKLSVINDKFQKNSMYLASAFNFESTDPFFQTKVTIAGQFGQWAIAGKNSNSLINVTIAVKSLAITGLPDGNITNATFTITLGLDLNFISDKNNANKKNLQFDYSGNGTSTGSDNISIISIDGSTNLNEKQKAVAGQAIKVCLGQNPDKLNYIFASALLKDEQVDWLSADNISFDLVTLSSGDTYFCIFGSNGPKTGQTGQVDASLFNNTDDMYLGISAALFMQRVILPGLKKSLPGSNPIFANPKIMIPHYSLPTTKVGLIEYTPEILLMSLEIKGSQILTKITGVCDLKANIVMSFTYSSASNIIMDKQSRSITISNDPNPAFDHSLDMPWWAWVSIVVVGPIVLAITEIVSRVIGSAVADSIKGQSSSNAIFSIQSISWSNVDFKTITNGGLQDNFYITGINN